MLHDCKAFPEKSNEEIFCKMRKNTKNGTFHHIFWQKFEHNLPGEETKICKNGLDMLQRAIFHLLENPNEFQFGPSAPEIWLF